ncbi:MAG TPA: type II secretion system F family protein [Candidatus Hypogeohydataceae bacterium YC41]
MPHYNYVALNDYGKRVKGILPAESEEDLALKLSHEGYYLLSASSMKASEKGNSKPLFTWGRKIRPREIITFTYHLSTVLSAGIPILQGLDDLVEQTSDPRFRRIITEIRNDVHGGRRLSEALMRHPEAFSELYVNILKAGEATGEIDKILHDLASFMEWQEEMKGNLKQAITYPIILLSAITLLVGYLFAFVLPKFTKILLDLKVPLPLPTIIVITVSDFMKSSWYFFLTGFAIIITTLKVISRFPWGRMALDSFKLQIPVFGELIRKIALSRFSHFMALLFKAGIDILQSLSVVERVVGNEAIAKTIRNAREQVRIGRHLSEPLKKSKQFPPMVVRMVEIGEVSGELDKSLEKVSKYYDREIPATIKRVFAVLEPAMIICLASMVLLVALSIYLPLYSSLGRLGR